jgi:hypothetical protein
VAARGARTPSPRWSARSGGRAERGLRPWPRCAGPSWRGRSARLRRYTTTTSLDETRAAAFGEKPVGTYVGGMVALLVDVASRTGLFDAPATGLGTSAEVASRAALERHVRKCLGAPVTAGVAVPFAL